MPPIPCRFCKALRFFGDSASVAETRLVDGEQTLFIGGEPLTDAQLVELAVEVDLIRKTGLWKIMTATVTQHAIKLGLKDAKDFDQTLFAKSMLHNVGLIDGILTAIELEKKRRKK